MVLHDRSAIPKQCNHVRCGGVAGVSDVRLERDTDHSHPGAAHRAHSHPNNYLSAVYYVRTFPGADTINFHDPRSQTGVLRPPVTELTGVNTDQVVVKVKDGTLLVFPSYLQHSVDANASGESRVSVSFNLMFSSAALSKPLWGEE